MAPQMRDALRFQARYTEPRCCRRGPPQVRSLSGISKSGPNLRAACLA
jgi:hypothetical protein